MPAREHAPLSSSTRLLPPNPSPKRRPIWRVAWPLARRPQSACSRSCDPGTPDSRPASRRWCHFRRGHGRLRGHVGEGGIAQQDGGLITVGIGRPSLDQRLLEQNPERKPAAEFIGESDVGLAGRAGHPGISQPGIRQRSLTDAGFALDPHRAPADPTRTAGLSTVSSACRARFRSPARRSGSAASRWASAVQ